MNEIIEISERKIDNRRMNIIASQLMGVIHLLLNTSHFNIEKILSDYTNMTSDEIVLLETLRRNTSKKVFDTMRMKEIISQLTDVIYLLCGANAKTVNTILSAFANMTDNERDALNIVFAQD